MRRLFSNAYVSRYHVRLALTTMISQCFSGSANNVFESIGYLPYLLRLFPSAIYVYSIAMDNCHFRPISLLCTDYFHPRTYFHRH